LREAREETGLDVEVLGPLDSFHFYRGPMREETIAITFHCQGSGGPVVLSSEHDEVKWVPIEHLVKLDDVPDWVQRFLQTFRARRESANVRDRQ
jgi:8-oxo-dGTP pyrophosphatase MutT (NUDIX family)